MFGALIALVTERLKSAGRHAALMAALYAGAGLMVVLAIAFVGVAAFAALAATMAPGAAGLVVSLGYLIVAGILVAAASMKPRQRHRETSPGEMVSTAMAAMPAVTSPLRTVRRRPAQSLLLAVAAGALVAVLTRNRGRDDHV